MVHHWCSPHWNADDAAVDSTEDPECWGQQAGLWGVWWKSRTGNGQIDEWEAYEYGVPIIVGPLKKRGLLRLRWFCLHSRATSTVNPQFQWFVCMRTYETIISLYLVSLYLDPQSTDTKSTELHTQNVLGYCWVKPCKSPLSHWGSIGLFATALMSSSSCKYHSPVHHAGHETLPRRSESGKDAWNVKGIHGSTAGGFPEMEVPQMVCRCLCL